MGLDISCRLDENGNLEFTTVGRWVSLNYIMARANWSSDGEITKIIKRKVRNAIRDISIWYDTGYQIVLRYNSRLDDHNCVMMPKFFTDAIKLNYEKNARGKYIKNADGSKIVEFEGFIPDDDKRYSGGTNFVPDNSLKHNTYVMTYERINLNWSVKAEKYAERTALPGEGDELGIPKTGRAPAKRAKVLRKPGV